MEKKKKSREHDEKPVNPKEGEQYGSKLYKGSIPIRVLRAGCPANETISFCIRVLRQEDHKDK